MGLWLEESDWQGGVGDLWHLEKQLLRLCMEKTGGLLISLSRFLFPSSPQQHTHTITGCLLNQSLEQKIILPGKLHLKFGQTVRNR